MSKFIIRFICLVCALLCLCGVSDAAPVKSGVSAQELSSVDDNHGLVASPHMPVDNRPRREAGAGPNEFHSLRGDDNGLLKRSWADDGSDIVVLERRNGFTDFFKNLGRKIKEGFQTAGRKIKEGFQTAGRKIKEGFQTAGKKIKEGFQTAGRKIKEGFQTAGRKMKEGFQKAGKWIKETGAKVAKFGLKVISTVAAVASHVVRFIPVVGQVASAALKGASFGLNKASEAIHANLGDKLEKGMHVMDIIQDPIGALAKKAAHHLAPIVSQKMHAHAQAHSAPHHAPPPPYHAQQPHHDAHHNPPPYHVAVHAAAPHHAPPPPYSASGHAAPAHHNNPPPAHHAPPPAHHAAPPPHHAPPPPHPAPAHHH